MEHSLSRNVAASYEPELKTDGAPFVVYRRVICAQPKRVNQFFARASFAVYVVYRLSVEVFAAVLFAVFSCLCFDGVIDDFVWRRQDDVVPLGAYPCNGRKFFARNASWVSRAFVRAPWAFVFADDKAGLLILFVDAAIKIKAKIRLQLFSWSPLNPDDD